MRRLNGVNGHEAGSGRPNVNRAQPGDARLRRRIRLPPAHRRQERHNFVRVTIAPSIETHYISRHRDAVGADAARRTSGRVLRTSLPLEVIVAFP
jgi:hypothetical protein